MEKELVGKNFSHIWFKENFGEINTLFIDLEGIFYVDIIFLLSDSELGNQIFLYIKNTILNFQFFFNIYVIFLFP